MVEVGRLDQIDTLFTDSAPPPAFSALLAEADVSCVIADPGPAGHAGAAASQNASQNANPKRNAPGDPT